MVDALPVWVATAGPAEKSEVCPCVGRVTPEAAQVDVEFSLKSGYICDGVAQPDDGDDPDIDDDDDGDDDDADHCEVAVELEVEFADVA